MSTVYSKPQLCSHHSSYYANFFVLRMAVSITCRDKAAEIGFSESKEGNISCYSPITKYLDINLVSPKWEEVLNKYGVSHISQFWCADVPSFQVSFSSKDGIGEFIKSQQRMRIEMAMVVAESSSQSAEDMKCVVETELFLVAPDVERKDAKFTKVTDRNCSSCYAKWKESKLFEFGPTFITSAVTKGLSLSLLVSELSDVVEWFTFGLLLGVPESHLLRIERERPFSIMERLNQVLIWWFKNGQQQTWSAVVRVLLGIRMRRLAEKIAVKYNVALPADALPYQTELHVENGMEGGPAWCELLLERQRKRDAEAQMANTKKKLMSVHEKISIASVMASEAEKQLKYKEKELQRIRNGDESITDPQSVIESKIVQLKEQLSSAKNELSRTREERDKLNKEFQKVTMELVEKSKQVRELERDKVEMEGKREMERCRADMNMMQQCARRKGEISPLERESSAELEDNVREKEEEVLRLSSQWKATMEKQEAMAQVESQSPQEEDQLVRLSIEVCELRASLVEAEDRQMRAEMELEHSKNRNSVIKQIMPAPQTCKAKTQVDKVEEVFEITKNDMIIIMHRLIESFEKGLERDGEVVKMLPTYVFSLPDGNEEGEFLAVDFGGSTFRIVLVAIEGKETKKLKEEKYKVESSLKKSTQTELFDFIAECISKFIKQHEIKKKIPVAFTFSFPVLQTSLTSGTLLRWTKGFKVSGAVGEDVVVLLKKALQRKMDVDVDVDVVALVSDTTGTLMAIRCRDPYCYVGLCVGTGFNACYLEKLDAVKKFPKSDESKHSTMIINCEFGALGDGGELDPWLTEFDKQLNDKSLHRGQQTYEKMAGKEYLGEIARLAIQKLIQEEVIFGGKSSDKFDKVEAFKTKHVVAIQGAQGGKDECKKILKDNYGIDATDADCEVVMRVCGAVTLRAARLAGTAVVAVVRKINKLDSCHVAVDGSLFKLDANFQAKMEEAMDELHPGNSIAIKVSEDGSGRGAAMVAAVATRQN